METEDVTISEVFFNIGEVKKKACLGSLRYALHEEVTFSIALFSIQQITLSLACPGNFISYL